MAKSNRARLRDAAQTLLDSLKPVPQEKPEPTINEVFFEALKRHWSKPRYQQSGWAKNVERFFLNLISPKFGHRKLSSLTLKEVRHWHEGMFLTPFAANRALGILSKIFSFAEEQELKSISLNPCKRVELFPEKKRKRFATPEELQKICALLDSQPWRNRKSVAFIYLLIFTGARPSAIERATWDDLSFIEKDGKRFGLLKIHGKSSNDTDEEETVVLPPQALAKIEKLSRWSKTICDTKMPSVFWKRIRKEAGCEGLWARDFRRTFATIGLSNGTSIGLIGELLNHKSAQTTMIYAKLLDDTKLKATGEIADSIDKILRGGSQ